MQNDKVEKNEKSRGGGGDKERIKALITVTVK